MGTYVEIELNCVVPAAKTAEALAVVNALFEPRVVSGTDRVWTPNYSWVDAPPAGGFADLVEALKAWRYATRLEPNGDVVIEYFSGQKWGDDEMLYLALAPHLAPGSTIHVRSRNGGHWAYEVGEDGRLIEGMAELRWEQETTGDEEAGLSEARDALVDLLDQLAGVGLYLPGEDEGQWHGAEGLSFARAEAAAGRPATGVEAAG